MFTAADRDLVMQRLLDLARADPGHRRRGDHGFARNGQR